MRGGGVVVVGREVGGWGVEHNYMVHTKVLNSPLSPPIKLTFPTKALFDSTSSAVSKNYPSQGTFLQTVMAHRLGLSDTLPTYLFTLSCSLRKACTARHC